MLSLTRLKRIKRRKLLEQCSADESEETWVCAGDTSDGVMVDGPVSLFTQPPVIKGSLCFEPSGETKYALLYIDNLKESTLTELEFQLLLMRTSPASKYKTQCLILLRNLHLVKSMRPLTGKAVPYEMSSLPSLPSLPPLEWMGGLG